MHLAVDCLDDKAETDSVAAQRWSEWKRAVVSSIRLYLGDALTDISEDDVDWDAWRSLYESGCSPAMAVNRAYLRDI